MPVQGWLPKKEEEMNVREKLRVWEETHVSYAGRVYHKDHVDWYTIVGNTLSRENFLCELTRLEDYDEDKFLHPINGFNEALEQLRKLRSRFPTVKYKLYRLIEQPERLED